GLLTKEARGDRLPEGVRVLEVGFGDLGISSWSTDYGSLFSADVAVMADTSAALPVLLAVVREVLAGDDEDRTAQREARREELGAAHRRQRAAWLATAQRHVEGEPMSTPRLVLEVGRALQGRDWVLTAGTGN